MYSNILVALDGGEMSPRVLDAALTLASTLHAQLHPVYIVEASVMAMGAPGYDPSILIATLREEGERLADEASKLMAARGVIGTPLVAEADLGQTIAHRILSAAEELDADLIVMGTHGRSGLRRLMLGSVAESVLRHASIPVLMITPHDAQHDAAPLSREALDKEPS